MVLRLRQREVAVQNALNSMEAQSMKLGESHTMNRFSLQLEVDRLKRDIERLEGAHAGLASRESKTRDWDDALDKLHA